MARFFGADTEVITFEEQAAKDTPPPSRAARRRGSHPASPLSPSWPRRSRQDHAPRFHPLHQRSRGEAAASPSTSAHTRLPSPTKSSPPSVRNRLPRYARSRSLHPHAFARSQATDIVVLVTAAMTASSPDHRNHRHAHAAEVPSSSPSTRSIKPEHLPERRQKQLADRGLVPKSGAARQCSSMFRQNKKPISIC